MSATGYYLSSLDHTKCQKVAASVGRRLHLYPTAPAAIATLPQRILREGHPTVALDCYVVQLGCEDTHPLNGTAGEFYTNAGMVVNSVPLADALGSVGRAGLARLEELVALRFRRPSLYNWRGWLRYILGGWREQAAKARAAWEQHISLLASALADGTLLTSNSSLVPVDGYVKTVELAIARIESNLTNEERAEWQVMFDSSCALLGKRFAAFGHRYHECQGLITILAVAAATASAGVAPRSVSIETTYRIVDDIIFEEYGPMYEDMADPTTLIARSFPPLFAMLHAGGVATVYQQLGSSAERIVATPIHKTLVERVTIPAYYAEVRE